MCPRPDTLFSVEDVEAALLTQLKASRDSSIAVKKPEHDNIRFTNSGSYGDHGYYGNRGGSGGGEGGWWWRQNTVWVGWLPVCSCRRMESFHTLVSKI